MKRLHCAILSVVVLLGLATTIVWASPTGQDGLPDLVPTDISWTPDTVYPGDEVTVEITYENRGTAMVPEDAKAKFRIVMETTDDPPKPVGVSVEGDIPGAAGLVSGAPPAAVAETLIAPAEGSYSVVVTLDIEDTVAEADEENNQRSEPFTVKSALPPGVSRLFAGLGMFAAVMAIVAVGTEVIIDTLKLFLGMKRKVTTLEALDKMEKLLPGQLSDLGVDPAAQQTVQGYVDGLRTTLKPTIHAGKTYKAVKEGRLHDAFQEIQKFTAVKKLADLAKRDLEGYAPRIKNELAKALDNLQGDLGLSQAFIQDVKTRVESEVDAFSDQTNILDVLDSMTMFLQEKVPDLTEDWLQQQADKLAQEKRDEVQAIFDEKVAPALEGLGLQKEHVAQMSSELGKTLLSLESSFIKGLGNLLNAVEKRRNDMQSPIRKLWRQLRKAAHGDVWVAVVIGILAWVIGGIIVGNLEHHTWISGLGLGFVIGVATGGVIWLLIKVLAWLGVLTYEGTAESTWSDFRRIEILWNTIRMEEDIDPQKFGEAEQIDKLSPATAAQVVLESSDQQRDEESSRLRWLRVTSVFVGVVLAYLLQIDAAKLLEAAVPGIERTINVFSPLRLSVLPHLEITPGIILTGLAASAGSTFWHDQLDRLQSAKRQAEAAAKLVRQVKDLTGTEE